jgi:hypothetical protein
MLTTYVVTYGQHRIGVARAYDADEAAYLVVRLFSDGIEREKLKAYEPNAADRDGYDELLGPEHDKVVVVLL